MDLEGLKESLIRREDGPSRVPLWQVPPERAAEMAKAADVVEECGRSLAESGSSVVAEVLRGQDAFTQWKHYPKGDVYDKTTHGQYYYHAHPSDLRGGEHGHFHTFVRAGRLPKPVKPAHLPATVDRPLDRKALAHLVGISMDQQGNPVQLFTVNRWVTGESWYVARDVIALLDRFEISHAVPGRPTDRWIGAMVRLFRPQIEWLLRERDAAVRVWRAGNPDSKKPVWDDRKLEITSVIDISVAAQIRLVRAAACV